MLDAVEGALSRGRTVLVGWILPFGLVAIPTLVLLSAGQARTYVSFGSPAGDSDGGFTEGGAAVLESAQPVPAPPVFWPSQLAGLFGLLVLVAFGGLVLNLFRTPMYRILTGNLLWPRSLADRRAMSHYVRRNRLRDRAVVRRGPARALLLERARRYPGSSDQIAPTLFGNAVRRVETYGFDRFRLDARLLWQELRSLVPATVLREEVRARGALDFFVCLFWSLVLAVIAILVGFSLAAPSAYLGLGIGLVVALVGAFGAYHGAVRATDRWDSTVRGLVNLGRTPLADSLGLSIPEPLEQEREMWRRVNWLVRLDFDERLQPELDPYRAKETQGPLREPGRPDRRAAQDW